MLYVSDRGAGKVSVISFARHRTVATWTIPGGGSPDMGGVSADGKMLWLTGRYDGVVYGFDTASRSARRQDQSRREPPRHGRLATTRPLQPRPYGEHAMNR